jgi:site-specific DNA recombinase
MTRRAGLYDRLSLAKLTDTATDDAQSRQQERSRAFATAKGWEVVEVFSDVDRSAYRAPGQKAPPRREQFERALAAVEADEIDALVFFKLDRLCRDHGDFERVLATCERHGAVLASVMEPIDTSTPAGEMSARMLVGFARLESQTIGLRVAAQREQTASRGLPNPGGWRPFGYRYVPKTDQAPARYEAVPEEAAVVIEAARRLLAGESLNSIARDFHRRGIRAANGSSAFYTRRLRRILVNPTIAGLRSYRGEVVRDATWPPILDRGTWEAVRAILNDPKRGRGGHPLRWPFSRLVVCGCPGCTPPKHPERAHNGECGVPMLPKGTHGRMAYACDPTKPGFKGCGRISIDAGHLETIVLKMIAARDWRHLAAALREQAAGNGNSSGSGELAEQLAADEEHLRQVAIQYGLRQLSEPEWQAIRETLIPRIEAAHRQLQQRLTLPREAIDGSSSILEAWEKWTVEQKRAVLRALFHRIVVGPATRPSRGPDPDRLAPPYGPVWKV